MSARDGQVLLMEWDNKLNINQKLGETLKLHLKGYDATALMGFILGQADRDTLSPSIFTINMWKTTRRTYKGLALTKLYEHACAATPRVT